MNTVAIGEHIINDSSPTFVVAEMSANHGGRLENALKLVQAAARAGANAVKLQTYTADTITLKNSGRDFLIEDGPWTNHRTMWDLYSAAYTPWEWHAAIFEEAKNLGLEIFSSPFDESAVNFLEELSTPAYKIASPEINHIPLLKKVAQTGKPVILSTGVAELRDIEKAVYCLRDHGCNEIAVMKCNSSYPAPLSESNLLTIVDISKRFSVVTGLSDHTMDNISAIVSIALGAKIIEKHLCLDSEAKTVDSFFSMDEERFTEFVNQIRKAELACGSVSYEIAKSAMPNVRSKRSIYISGNISKGTPFSRENIKCIRPSYGLDPCYYDEIIGKTAAKDLNAGDRLLTQHINESLEPEQPNN